MPVQQQQYQQQHAYGGSNVYASVQSNPFAPAAPTPVHQPTQNFAASSYEAPAADPFSMPAFAQPPSGTAYIQPHQQQPAPVSNNDPFYSQPAASEPAPTNTTAAANDGGSNVYLTMGNISSDGGGLLAGSNAPATSSSGGGGGTSLADKALQNLMGSIDSYGLAGKTSVKPTSSAAAKNPFDTNNIMNNATLGEIKSTKSGEKKSVMNAPPGPGALVMGSNQTGNWGGYGGGLQQQQQSQYGGFGASMQQPPQYTMSGGYPQQQQPPQMGMQAQQSSFGMQPQQQSMMGQQPPMMGQQPQMGMTQGQQPPMQQQGYGGAPQFGQQQQQPPMQQQNQWGAPYY